MSNAGDETDSSIARDLEAGVRKVGEVFSAGEDLVVDQVHDAQNAWFDRLDEAQKERGDFPPEPPSMGPYPSGQPWPPPKPPEPPEEDWPHIDPDGDNDDDRDPIEPPVID